MLVSSLRGVSKGTDAYHEIEPSHEQDEICQKNPVPLQSNLSFCDESLSNARAVLANFLAFYE